MPAARTKKQGANLLDRAIGWVSPGTALRRMRGRVALDAINKFYEAAGTSRRTQGWARPSGDPNAPSGSLSLQKLRDAARHLVRNNGHAESGLGTIVDDAIGWGIFPTVDHEPFKAWSSSTDIDADGRCDLPGLEMMIMRTIAEAGECLVRRRMRRPSDGFAIPLQIQVLEPDYIDTGRHVRLRNGAKIVRGVEFDSIGRRVAYWLFPDHPGSSLSSIASSDFRSRAGSGMGSRIASGRSVRVPATEILHIFKPQRPGQVRGASWFSPVLIRFNEYDEYADAQLMKQKIAACLAVITSDVNGLAEPIGTEDPNNEKLDMIGPGLILNVAPGRSVDVVQPPTVAEFSEYSNATLREIAAGIGVAPEDLHGDYSKINFSAARMSRLKHWGRVQGWRWRMLVPQFLNPLWNWAMLASELAGLETVARTGWTAPPLAMIEPDKEGLAILRNIRAGIMTQSEALRERGFIPRDFWDEYAADVADLDDRGLVLDTDPRQMTQAGQAQVTAAAPADPTPANGNGARAGALLEPGAPLEPCLTIPEAATKFKIDPDTLRAWCRKGVLPHTRVGPGIGRIRVTETDIARVHTTPE